jgi:hypothetical protein
MYCIGKLDENYLSIASSAFERITSPSVEVGIKISLLLGFYPLLGLVSTGEESTSSERYALVRRFVDHAQKLLLDREPKFSRVAGWVLGKTYKSFFLSAKNGVDNEILLGHGAQQKDPNDFSRLQESTSFLRATFEVMCSIVSNKTSQDKCCLLITCLDSAKIQLPPVNWLPCLRQLLDCNNSELIITCFSFICNQLTASPPRSMVELFILIFSKIQDMNFLLEKILTEEGLGQLLSISGIQDANKQSSGANPLIAPSRTIDIVKTLGTLIFSLQGEKADGYKVCRSSCPIISSHSFIFSAVIFYNIAEIFV